MIVSGAVAVRTLILDLTMALTIGFALGYGVREWISRRRAEDGGGTAKNGAEDGESPAPNQPPWPIRKDDAAVGFRIVAGEISEDRARDRAEERADVRAHDRTDDRDFGEQLLLLGSELLRDLPPLA